MDIFCDYWKEPSCPTIVGILDGDEIIDGQELVISDASEIEIEYDYPLSVTVHKSFTNNTDSWTRQELANAIAQGYQQIYDEENATQKEEFIPGMLNRTRTNGPYGIWGHVISDLYLEEVVYHGNGKIKLGIGS